MPTRRPLPRPALTCSEVNQDNLVITGVKSYFHWGDSSEELFVTIPRWKSGVPSTLHKVHSNGGLEPYPDCQTQAIARNAGECASKLQNVQVRVHARHPHACNARGADGALALARSFVVLSLLLTQRISIPVHGDCGR